MPVSYRFVKGMSNKRFLSRHKRNLWMPLRHVHLTKLLDELQVQRRHLAQTASVWWRIGVSLTMGIRRMPTG